MTFDRIVKDAGVVMDAAGVIVIVAGSALATLSIRGRLDGAEKYRRYREQLGHSILLGLELLVAGDIIRTVAVTPTASSVAVLAVVVAIRTFLSLSLELEITGRWPWQRQSHE
jgi:uncharacterized membrane protein